MLRFTLSILNCPYDDGVKSRQFPSDVSSQPNSPLPVVGICQLQPPLGLLQNVGPRHGGHEGSVVLQLALRIRTDTVAEPGGEEGLREVDLESFSNVNILNWLPV